MDPLFYYFLHVFVIHEVAILGILLFGGNWQDMILTSEVFMNEKLTIYGYPLYVVYIVWISIVIFFYPFSKRYMQYKANNRDIGWLSYL